MILLTFGAPLASSIFMYKGQELLNTDKFMQQYGTLYQK